MGDQRYGAWFTTYPSTHERAGATVEVVPRELLERSQACLGLLASLTPPHMMERYRKLGREQGLLSGGAPREERS